MITLSLWQIFILVCFLNGNVLECHCASGCFLLPPPTSLLPPPHAPPCEAGVGGGGGGGQPFVSNLVAACRTPGSVHFQDNPLLLLQIASVRLSQPHL